MKKGDGLFLVALLAATVFVYLGGLRAPPAFDDTVVGMYPLRLGTPGAMLKGFLHPVPAAPQGVPLPAYAYRPLTEASLVLNARLAGSALGLAGLRLGNLLIHLAACLVVFRLARAFGGQGAAFARWAALFFALHPLGVEAVTYVYQRAASLEALLAFLTMGLYWSARGRKVWGGRYVAALACGLLAMTAKETGVTLPLILAAVEWVLRDPAEPIRAVWKRWIPFAFLGLLPLAMFLRASAAQEASAAVPVGTVMESGFHPTASGHGRLEYLLLEMPVVAGYLFKAFLPFPLHFYHDQVLPLPGETTAIPWLAVTLCGAALLGLVAWILLGPSRHRLPRVGLALFLAPLALESSVFPIQDLAFYHRCNPSLLGAALLFAWAAARLGSWKPPALALFLLAALTVRENRIWADPLELLRRDVRAAWHRSVIWASYAWELKPASPRRAERLFRHALRLPWQNPRTLLGLASSLSAQGRDAEAALAYDAALKAFPEDPTLLWQAVVQAIPMADEARLEALCAHAGKRRALRPELALWLACRRLEQGRPAEAETLLRRELGCFPTHPQLLDLLGRSLQLQERPAEAAAQFRLALDVDPSLEDARRDLEAILLQSRGNPAE